MSWLRSSINRSQDCNYANVWPRSVNTTAQEGSAESATSVLYIPDELAPAGGGTLRQGFAHDLVFAPARLSSGS
jgi:hypothetical protein